MLRTGIVVLAVAAATACSRPPEARQYELKGQILAVRPERREVLIRHEDIEGFMPAMTMPFKVNDAELLAGKQAGDLVTATLVVGEVDAHLSTLTKTGTAPVPEGAGAAATTGPAILQEGETVADAPLVDQSGAPRPFSSFRGHRVALTFIYTRCPLPEFCPLMDRNFAAVQKVIKSRSDLDDVRLVTVTFDPQHDTPAVLTSYAGRVRADAAVWSFLTGEPHDVARFAEQFGIYTEQSAERPVEIVHNLRTAVVDPEGRLVSVTSGNAWTPSDLVADLEAAPAPAN
jgi:protein SCO1/2